MSLYLVDTASLIDFSKGIEPQRSRLLAVIEDPDHDVGVCDVIVTEFLSGIASAYRADWRRFFESLTYWDVSLDAAERAGADRFDYARQGIQISAADALIAAVARVHGAILITENPKHYPMPDITLLSLR